jgi:hypothetical protein
MESFLWLTWYHDVTMTKDLLDLASLQPVKVLHGRKEKFGPQWIIIQRPGGWQAVQGFTILISAFDTALDLLQQPILNVCLQTSA